MQDRSSGDGRLMPTTGTLPESLANQFVSAVMPAARAHEPIRPPAPGQVLLAAFLCGELRLELAQVPGERRPGHGPTLPVVAC